MPVCEGSLERQWQVSRSPLQAAMHGRHFSIVSLACISASLGHLVWAPLVSHMTASSPAYARKMTGRL
jgi:hypothetical protein